MTTTAGVATDAYRRALAAEPQLQAVEATVDALSAFVRRSDTMCAGCVWEAIVKPLASPWVGWARGFLPHPAKDPDPTPGASWRFVNLAEWIEQQPKRVRSDASTDTERWLRTSDAFDAVTDVWLARLDAADPAHGHGIHRGHHEEL